MHVNILRCVFPLLNLSLITDVPSNEEPIKGNYYSPSGQTWRLMTKSCSMRTCKGLWSSFPRKTDFKDKTYQAQNYIYLLMHLSIFGSTGVWIWVLCLQDKQLCHMNRIYSPSHYIYLSHRFFFFNGSLIF
jgi:hypothetical protein